MYMESNFLHEKIMYVAAKKQKKWWLFVSNEGNVALASIMQINIQKREEQKKARAQRRLRVLTDVLVCVCLIL